jgi:hypothetical protein
MTLGDLRAKRKYQAHSVIRTHARKKYLKSDQPQQCLECGYELQFDVCHIKDIYKYEETETLAVINAMPNLVALCKVHHWEFDNGHLSIQSILKNPTYNFCKECKTKVTSGSQRCHKCKRKHTILNSKTKDDWPRLKELILDTCSSSYRSVGKKIGKSDVAVKKHIIIRLDLLLEAADLDV